MEMYIWTFFGFGIGIPVGIVIMDLYHRAVRAHDESMQTMLDNHVSNHS